MRRSSFDRIARPLLQWWWRLNRGLTLGVRGIVENAAGQIALVRHTYTPGWYLPGGGVEFNETAETALRRELKEEAGVDATGSVDLLGIYSNRDSFPGDHVLLYRVRTWRACEPDFGSEIAEIGWFSPDDLPEGATPATRRRLAEACGGAERSESW